MCDWYTTGHISGSSFYRIRCNSRQGESQSCGRVANSPKCNRSTFADSFKTLRMWQRHSIISPQKDVVFSWSNDCSRAFKTFKCKLIGAPILVYPRVDKEASQFQLQTDASALGLGAVGGGGGGGGGGMLLPMLSES